MIDVLANSMLVNILQFISALNQYVVHLVYTVLYLNKAGVKNRKNENKNQKRIHQANTNQKNDVTAVLEPDKINFRQKKLVIKFFNRLKS